MEYVVQHPNGNQYAFPSEENARGFMLEYGGTLQTPQQAVVEEPLDLPTPTTNITPTEKESPTLATDVRLNGEIYEFPDRIAAEGFISQFPDAELLSDALQKEEPEETQPDRFWNFVKEENDKLRSGEESLLDQFERNNFELGMPLRDDEVTFRSSMQKGAQRLMTTWYTLADMIQGTEQSALKLKQAQEEYDAMASDPRIAEAIQLATQASDAQGGSFTAAAKEMLGFFLRNPTAAINFFGEQLPSVLAALPAGGGAGFLAAKTAAKFLRPAISRIIGTATGGSSLASTSVVFGALGPNYMEGLKKFGGDVEKAREYAVDKTVAEVPANAIAGTFIGFSPFSKFIKSPSVAATADVATQFGIQGTGGALGAKQAAEAVGEEAQMGELALEALGEGITAPVDIVATRNSLSRARQAENIISAAVKDIDPTITAGIDLEPLKNAVANSLAKGASREEIDSLVYQYVIDKAQGVESDATQKVEFEAQENVEQTAAKDQEEAQLSDALDEATPSRVPQAVRDMQRRLDVSEGVRRSPTGDQLELDLDRPELSAKQKQERIIWLDDTQVAEEPEDTSPLRQQELDLEVSEFDDEAAVRVPEPVAKPTKKPKTKKAAPKKTLDLTTPEEKIVVEEARDKLKNTDEPVETKTDRYKNIKQVGLGDVARDLGKIDTKTVEKNITRDPDVEVTEEVETEVTPRKTYTEQLEQLKDDTFARMAKRVTPEVKENINTSFDRVKERLRNLATKPEEAPAKEPEVEAKPAPKKTSFTVRNENVGRPGMDIDSSNQRTVITDNETGLEVAVRDVRTPAGERDAPLWVLEDQGPLLDVNYENLAVVGTTRNDAVAAAKKLITAAKKELQAESIAPSQVSQAQFLQRLGTISRNIYGNVVMDTQQIDGKPGRRVVATNVIPRGESRKNYSKIRKQLLKAIEDTNSNTTANKAYRALLWVLEKNPRLADNLALEIDSKKDALSATKTGAQGAFFSSAKDPDVGGFMRTIYLFTNRTDSVSAGIHELLHRAEQFLPNDIREAIRDEWRKEIDTTIADLTAEENKIIDGYINDAKQGVYTAGELKRAITQDLNLRKVQGKRAVYELIILAHEGDLRARTVVASAVELRNISPAIIEAAQKSIQKYPDLSNNPDLLIKEVEKLSNLARQPGDLIPIFDSNAESLKFYSQTDPSEWWAVNGSDLLVKASEKDKGWVGKAKRWLSEFVNAILDILGPGYNRDNGLVRGLEYILSDAELYERTAVPLEGMETGEKMGSVNRRNTEILLNRLKRKLENAETSQTFTEVYQGFISVDNNVGKDGAKFAGKNLGSVLGDKTLGAALLSSDTFTLFEVLRKSNIKSLNTLADGLDKQIDGLNFERQEILELGQKTYDKLSEFILGSPVGGRLLQEVMTDSTVIRFDPSEYKSIVEAIQKDPALVALRKDLTDKNLTEAEKADIQSTIDGRTKDMRSVYSRWELLGKMKRTKQIAGSPDTRAEAEGHKIYKEVRDVYADMLNRNEEIQLSNIKKLGISEKELSEVEAKIKKMYQQIRDEGVYFPLLRFGDYWIKVADGPDKGLWTFEKEAERDAFRMQVERGMQAQGLTPDEANISIGNNRRELRDTYENTDNLLGTLYTSLEDLKTKKLGSTDTIDVVEQIKDQILNIYLTTLPDRDLRTRLAKRKATPGYSYDQARAFSFYMGAASAQLPRLRRKRDAELVLSQARDAVKGQPYQVRINKIIDELEQRTKSEFSPEPQSELLRKLENLSGQSIFYTSLLGVDTAIQNYNVLATFAPAVLVQKYGLGALKSLGTYLALGKGAQQIATGSITAENINETSLDTAVGSLGNLARVKNNPFLKAAYEYANNRGLFGTNYLEQFLSAGYAPTESSIGQPTTPIKNGMRRLGKLISFPFRYSERHVREIVYLAAVEEAYKAKVKTLKREGKPLELNEEQVIEIFEAAKLDTKEIAFDYSRFNKAFNKLVTAGGVGGFLARNASRLQSFRLQAIAFVVRNLAMSLGGIRHLPAAERKAAFTKLMSFSALTALTAGTTGVMGYTLVTSIINAILNEMDEDDPTEKTRDPIYRDDFTLWMKEVWLPENVGNEKLRLMLTNGVIDTATGYNFAAMLNMDSMIAPSLYGSPTASLDMRGRLGSLADSFLGVGYDRLLDFSTFVEKVGTDLVRGNFDRALGNMAEGLKNTLPNIKDASEAYRLAKVGEVDKDTKNLVRAPENVTTKEVLMRVIGREPLEISERRDAELRMTRVLGEARASRTNLRRQLKDNMRELKHLRIARPGTSEETIMAERAKILAAINVHNDKYPTAELPVYETIEDINKELIDEANDPKRRSGVSQEEAEMIQRRAKKAGKSYKE